MPYVFIAAAFAYRLLMLKVLVRNEHTLRAGGANEIGAANSRLLAAMHVAFYVAASIEGLLRRVAFDRVSALGLALYLLGAAMLFVVARLLGRLWTVKVMIAPDHCLVTHPLFRSVRHPNYYLNILPELLGFAFTLHAFVTLAAGLPLYLIPLVTRIRQEEAAMRSAFPSY